MNHDPVARAERLLHTGNIREAVALMDQAGRSGSINAMFQLAMWKLTGAPVPRDLPGARALLRHAASFGNTDAALIEIALTANGSGAPADWSRACGLLDDVAKTDATAAAQRLLLAKMALTADGAPPALPRTQTIGKHPDIRHIAKLFTREECLHIAQCAVDMLQPATVADPRTGQNIANPVRTSDGAVIGPTRETLVVQALNRRLAAATGTDWRQGEALAVLRYKCGQQFRPHVDALPTTCNQRIRTVLVYLNDGFSGGATYFVNNALRVTPSVGDAIIFDNVRANGSIDPATQHAGEPVTAGVKWLATRWIRERPFSVWTGPESA
jgi:prolyl 4-hydroxylase